MIEWIKNLFVIIFGSHSLIATMIISMVPIIELRGAIPIGMDKGLWGNNALSLWESFGISVLGCSIVCVILTFAFLPLFKWLKTKKWCKKITDFIENKLIGNSKNINDKIQEEKNKKRALWIKIAGVFMFVAIPLPLTGVWTGTCLSLFVGLDAKQTIPTVILGNIVAGLIMSLLSYVFADNTFVVFIGFLALVLIFALFAIVKSMINKRKKSDQPETKNE